MSYKSGKLWHDSCPYKLSRGPSANHYLSASEQNQQFGDNTDQLMQLLVVMITEIMFLQCFEYSEALYKCLFIIAITIITKPFMFAAEFSTHACPLKTGLHILTCSLTRILSIFLCKGHNIFTNLSLPLLILFALFNGWISASFCSISAEKKTKMS